MYNNFFEKIDTEEKAYWLGFIAADGNIRKDMLVCSISLQRRDRQHLEKLSSIFENYYKIKDNDREYPCSTIRVYSKKCCEDLFQYGVTPNKSLTLNVKTDLIPQELVPHYIRGYFDGDGSIYCSHPNRTSGYNYDEWGCNFVGTYQDLFFFKEYLSLSNKIVKKGKIYELDINGTKKAYDALKKIYENATIYLDRKKEKFDELSSSQRLNKLVSKRNYFAEEKDTSVIVGYILGGASIRNCKIVKQDKNKEKIEYVKTIFDKYNYQNELVLVNTNHGSAHQLRVQVSPEVAKHYKHQFYPNGNKTITRHLLNELNNDALLLWFILNSHNIDSGRSLGTLRFTVEENKTIQQYFKVVHKIDVNIRFNRNKPYIFLPKKAKEYLFNMVCVPRGFQ